MLAGSLSSSEQETDGFHTADELYEEPALGPVTSRGKLSVETVCKDVSSGRMKSVYVQYDPIKMIPQGVQCKQEQRDQSTQTDPIDLLGSREDGAVCTCPHEPNSNKHKSVCEKGTNKSEYSAGKDQIDDDDNLSVCFLEAVASTIVPSIQEELNLVSSSQSPILIVCLSSDDEQSCSVHTPSTSVDHVGIHQCMNISSSLRNTKNCHELDAKNCMEIGNVENDGSAKCNSLSRLVKDPSSGLKSTRSSPLQKKMGKKGSVEEIRRIEHQESRETGSPLNKRSDCVDDEEESSEDLLRQMGNVEDSPAADETQSVNGKSVSSQRLGYRDTQNSEPRRIGSPSREGNKCFHEGCSTPRVSRGLSQAPDKDSSNPFFSSLAVERSSSPESLYEEDPEGQKVTYSSFRSRMFRIRLEDGGAGCSCQRDGVNSADEHWCSDYEERLESDKIAQPRNGDTSVKPPTHRKKGLVPYSDSKTGSDCNKEGRYTSKGGKGKGQRRSRSGSKRVDMITLSSDTDTSTYSEDEGDESSLTHSRDHSGKSNRRRLQYTHRERREIVFYIVHHNLYKHVGGNMMWKEMERVEICPGRTWQSLKEHFRKKILSHIQDYNITEKEMQKFLALKKL